jgi:predicted transcriptional regulator of viral defense system
MCIVIYTMSKQLDILDDLVAAGKETFESRDVQVLAGLSPQSTANILSRLVTHGLVDRVARGRYAIRSLGALGTRAASEDVTLAVAAAFGRRPHRIAYRSALDHHGLIDHPSREIIVVLDRSTRTEQVSGRRLRTVVESPHRIGIGAVPAGRGVQVSSVERALLESAARPGLAGGTSAFASALAAAHPDINELLRLGHVLGARAAIQRIGSLAQALGLDELDARLKPLAVRLAWTRLDPDSNEDEGEWRDDTWRVVWPYSVEELEESVHR